MTRRRRPRMSPASKIHVHLLQRGRASYGRRNDRRGSGTGRPDRAVERQTAAKLRSGSLEAGGSLTMRAIHVKNRRTRDHVNELRERIRHTPTNATAVRRRSVDMPGAGDAVLWSHLRDVRPRKALGGRHLVPGVLTRYEDPRSRRFAPLAALLALGATAAPPSRSERPLADAGVRVRISRRRGLQALHVRPVDRLLQASSRRRAIA